MFRYKLRTLLIVLALAPPALALAWPIAETLLFPLKYVTPRIILGEEDDQPLEFATR